MLTTHRNRHRSATDTLERAEEEFYARTSGAVLRINAARKIVYANDVLAQLLGYANGRMLCGLPFAWFVFPHDLQQHLQQLEATGKQQCAMREQRLRHRDGSERHCVVTAIRLEDARGDYVGSLALINEYRVDEDAAAATGAPAWIDNAEQQFRNLYELSSQGLALWNASGGLADCNAAFRHLIGLHEEELKSLSFHSMVASGRLSLRKGDTSTIGYQLQDAAADADMQLLMRAGDAGPYEAEYLKPDGTRCHLIVRLVFLRQPGRPSRIWSIIDDVSERKQAEARLLASEARYRQVVNNLKEVVFQTDTEGRWLFLNSAWSDITGFAVEKSIGAACLNFIHPEDRQRHRERFDQLCQHTAESYRQEIRYLHKDGGFCWVEVFARPMQDDGGRTIGTSGTLTDIGERRQAEEKSRLASSVFTHAREGIVVTAADTTIIEVNAAFELITGYRRGEVVGKKPNLLHSGRHDAAFYRMMWDSLHSKGYWQGEVWNRRKDGEVYVELLTISAVCEHNGQTVNYVGLFSDITRQKEHERQLEYLAHYDPLTRLPNRRLLADRLRQSIAQSVRRGTYLVVAYLDLDGFKAVNDAFGHAYGDQLLVAIATRLVMEVRAADTVSRLGGDEFVILLNDLPSIESSVPMLQRLSAAVAEPLQIDGHVLQVAASIGIAPYPQATEIDADQLLREADLAMYQAKLTRKNERPSVPPSLAQLPK